MNLGGHMMNKKVLIVEDDLALKPFWELFVKRQWPNADLDWAVSGESGKKLIESCHINDHYTFIAIDLFLSGSDTGLDVLNFAQKTCRQVPIFVTSSAEELQLADEIPKSWENVCIVKKPLNLPRLERTLSLLEKELALSNNFFKEVP